MGQDFGSVGAWASVGIPSILGLFREERKVTQKRAMRRQREGRTVVKVGLRCMCDVRPTKMKPANIAAVSNSEVAETITISLRKIKVEI